MEDHDDRHAECGQVYEINRGLEDDGVGELDATGVAGWENGGRVGNGVVGADKRAEGDSALLAY